MRFLGWLLAGVLAACTPGTENAAAPPADQAAAPTPQPPEGYAETFVDCAWGEIVGAGLSIWGYSCPNARLVIDDSLPGVIKEFAAPEEAYRSTIVRLFEIAPGAPLETILPAVHAASPAPEIAQCALTPVEAIPGYYALTPSGALQEAYAAFLNGESDELAQPCGDMGPSEAGERFFFRLPGSDTKVAFVEFGSDIPQFDIRTLRAAP